MISHIFSWAHFRIIFLSRSSSIYNIRTEFAVENSENEKLIGKTNKLSQNLVYLVVLYCVINTSQNPIMKSKRAQNDDLALKI